MNILFNVEYLLTTYGYAGIFAIVFLESGIFFPLPGDSLLFTSGLLASVSQLKIWFLVPTIFIATFSGGLMGYAIGIYIEHLRRYAFLRRILKPEYIEKAHEFFIEHGKGAILLSRFVPFMRTFIPIAAGVARMPKPLFVRYSLISSLLWSAGVTLLGYFLGQVFPQIENYLALVIACIVIISLLPALAEYLRRRLRR